MAIEGDGLYFVNTIKKYFMLYKLSIFVFGCLVVITANCQLNNNTGNSANATIKTAVGNH